MVANLGNTLDGTWKPGEVNRNVQPLPPAPRRPSGPAYVPARRLTRMPKPIRVVKPEYTNEAEIAGIEGLVLLKVSLDDKGRVVRVKVIRRLGYGLDEAAVKAIRRMRFSPAYVGNRAVGTVIRVPIRFVLDD